MVSLACIFESHMISIRLCEPSYVAQPCEDTKYNFGYPQEQTIKTKTINIAITYFIMFG